MNLYSQEDRLRDELSVAREDARLAKARVDGMERLIAAQGERIKRLRKALGEHIGSIRVARVERGEVAK